MYRKTMLLLACLAVSVVAHAQKKAPPTRQGEVKIDMSVEANELLKLWASLGMRPTLLLTGQEPYQNSGSINVGADTENPQAMNLSLSKIGWTEKSTVAICAAITENLKQNLGSANVVDFRGMSEVERKSIQQLSGLGENSSIKAIALGLDSDFTLELQVTRSQDKQKDVPIATLMVRDADGGDAILGTSMNSLGGEWVPRIIDIHGAKIAKDIIKILLRQAENLDRDGRQFELVVKGETEHVDSMFDMLEELSEEDDSRITWIDGDQAVRGETQVFELTYRGRSRKLRRLIDKNADGRGLKTEFAASLGNRLAMSVVKVKTVAEMSDEEKLALNQPPEELLTSIINRYDGANRPRVAIVLNRDQIDQKVEMVEDPSNKGLNVLNTDRFLRGNPSTVETEVQEMITSLSGRLRNLASIDVVDIDVVRAAVRNQITTTQATSESNLNQVLLQANACEILIYGVGVVRLDPISNSIQKVWSLRAIDIATGSVIADSNWKSGMAISAVPGAGAPELLAAEILRELSQSWGRPRWIALQLSGVKSNDDTNLIVEFMRNKEHFGQQAECRLRASLTKSGGAGVAHLLVKIDGTLEGFLGVLKSKSKYLTKMQLVPLMAQSKTISLDVQYM